MARPSGRDIAAEVVQEATSVIATEGIARLTYTGLAERLGVKPTAIHHHYRYKEDLILRVVQQYIETFNGAVAGIDAPTATERLVTYGGIFVDAARREWLCLCTAATAEWSAVSDDVHHEVEAFFRFQLDWIEAQLVNGIDGGEFRHGLDTTTTALSIFAALEGALLLVRAGQPPAVAERIVANTLSLVTA